MKDKTSFFVSRCLFSGLGISYIIRLAGTNFWISAIIGTILGILILSFLKKISNNKLTNLIIGFSLITISGSILVNMGHSLYLKNTSVLILTIVPILAALYMSKSNEQGFIKVLNILFYYSIFLFLLKIITLYPYIEVENMQPFFDTSFKSVLWGSIVFALSGTVPILAFGNLNDKKGIIFNYAVSMITVISIMFLAVSVMGINEARLYRYPEYIVLKRIKILSFISNVDNIFNFAIVADLMVTMTYGFKKMNIKNKFSTYLITILIILSISWICNKNYPILYLYQYFPFVLIFLLILILLPKKAMYKKE